MSSAFIKQTITTVETLIVGALGGGVFYLFHLPGGLISGAMIAVAIYGVAFRPVGLPMPIAHGILMMLGLSLGAMVTPIMVKNIANYPDSIALLVAATFCATMGSGYYLQRFHGWDRTSALLAGSPGALSQMLLLATERDANVPGIAVVQIVRVIILTAAIPALLAATGMLSLTAIPKPADPATLPDLAILAAAALAVSLLFKLIRFPASWMFGAMLTSAVLHGGGWIEGGLPQWAYAAALAGIGALIGSRFGKMPPRTILSYLNAALGSFGVAIVISALFVGVAVLVLKADPSDAVVAFAPGAMDAMLALALTLHIDPIFVGAHHLARFIYVSVATPGIMHVYGKGRDDIDD